MPTYAKFLKELLTNKRKFEDLSTVELNEECSAIFQNKMPTKLKDPRSFTIPCLIGNLNVEKALADLGASINLMSYKMFKQLGLGEPKPTKMSIQLADRSIKYPRGIIEDVLVKVDKFIFHVDFSVLHMDKDVEVPLILGHPFLATARAVIDVGDGKLVLRVGEVKTELNPNKPVSRQAEYEGIKTNKKLKHKPPIEEPPKLELEQLPNHLEYAYLGNNSTLPVIIASNLQPKEKEELLQVLRQHKRAIAWKISDIKGISPSFCTHKILMKDEYKPCVQAQRRLNLNMKEVVKAEVIKLLDAGIIYPITDSSWVRPVQVVPKKGGMTVVTNEKNELIPTRIVIGWRVCIDYRKLNDATRKHHFPSPFIDQMLERLSWHIYYCFLDGLSGYFQIPIALEDQEKMTFTCPYGTFAYHRMPFGLCNAPATFQCCMIAIFDELVKDIMEVFTDDFSVFEQVIRRCVTRSETSKILEHYHSGLTGGHYSGTKTAHKILESGFYWPSLFKNANRYVTSCDKCQRTGNLSKRDEMPQNCMLSCEIFYVWGIDFIGPFPSSFGNNYILVAVDYMSKWVEAQALPTNDARVVVRFLKTLFSRFGTPRAIINDRGTHFCNTQFEKTLKKYEVNHKTATHTILKLVDKLKWQTERSTDY
ncbi:hypothetical protein CXB51_003844 [Gossypium anomalum]|uniref:Integrase catalytic domain-containing protein n=1 Tax=Gossypium anomalum TaxID=47600 RepID=A0A8J5ZPU6_9ROSI|nr:hypothetical protein CXB51_003844 [Gossypium anomalum]